MLRAIIHQETKNGFKMSYKPEWRLEDMKRVKLLNIWYLEDGRNNPEHPQHALFTGLAQKYKNRHNLEIDHVSAPKQEVNGRSIYSS